MIVYFKIDFFPVDACPQFNLTAIAFKEHCDSAALTQLSAIKAFFINYTFGYGNKISVFILLIWSEIQFKFSGFVSGILIKKKWCQFHCSILIRIVLKNKNWFHDK